VLRLVLPFLLWIKNNEGSSVWDVTIAGPPPRCQAWCRLVTVSTDPFTTFTRPTSPFLSERVMKCQPGNTKNGGTVLPIANLMADPELGSPSSYLPFILTIGLSRLISEIFTCDRETDIVCNADHYNSWPPYCDGPANNKLTLVIKVKKCEIVL